MQAIPSDILNNFRLALERSKDHNVCFLANIAQGLELSTEFFHDNATEYDELGEIFKLILTNLESNILRKSEMKHIDVKFAQFALEAVHGWKADGNDKSSIKITVEGISNEELQEYIADEDN